jgi:hypothetical protein
MCGAEGIGRLLRSAPWRECVQLRADLAQPGADVEDGVG